MTRSRRDRRQGPRARDRRPRLRSILEETLLDVQFELPSRRDVRKCVVTKETIDKGGPSRDRGRAGGAGRAGGRVGLATRTAIRPVVSAPSGSFARVKQLADGVWQLRGFPPDAISVYLVEDVLIDAATRHGGRRILRQLRDREVSAHALTHAHPDHQGASKGL